MPYIMGLEGPRGLAASPAPEIQMPEMYVGKGTSSSSVGAILAAQKWFILGGLLLGGYLAGSTKGQAFMKSHGLAGYRRRRRRR